MAPTLLEQRCNPRQAALIILDMQRGSWPPKGGAVGGEEALPGVIPLISAARKVSLPIVFVRNTHSDWTDLRSRVEQNARMGGPDLSTRYREGTPGTDFLPGLDPEPADLVYVKHSYSPFAHGPLDLALRGRRIKTLLLTGGSLLGAVETCAKDAYVRGYHVVVVSDAVHPSKGPVFEVVAKYIDERLGIVASSAEIIAGWEATWREGER